MGSDEGAYNVAPAPVSRSREASLGGVMQSRDVAALSAVLLTTGLLAFVQWKVELPMLLAERFIPGAGWGEGILLGIYAGWVTRHILDMRKSARWRRRIWALFSIVFFAQLLLGMAGIEQLLMTGKLHIPVPAMIVGGPAFRGHGFFMPVLFAITVVLVGPAWCSYLCYIGAWDSGFAHRKKRPTPLPRWTHSARIATLLIVLISASLLRWAGATGTVAAGLGITFGIVGVLLMMLWSHRTGTMAHCVAYCPIGWLATVLGKISPFRLRIRDACTDCGACTRFCRYDALSPHDIRNRRPGLSCTLCGDCQRACTERFIEYRFLGLNPDRARTVFLVLVVSLHATFLGVARI